MVRSGMPGVGALYVPELAPGEGLFTPGEDDGDDCWGAGTRSTREGDADGGDLCTIDHRCATRASRVYFETWSLRGHGFRVIAQILTERQGCGRGLAFRH